MAEQDKNVYYTYDYDSIQIEVIEQEHQDENKKEKKIFFKGKRFKILLVVVIGVVTLAGVSLWFFLGNKEKEDTCDTIVLTDNFFTVAFLTYDGYGEVYAELNYSMFVEAAEEIFSKRPEAEYDEMYGRKKAELLYNEISVELDNPYNLSNGDYVTVRVTVDEEALDSMGIDIEGRKFTFEVKGLKDVIEFNPFYYLGQGSPNIWHNPTNIAVKGFAVLCFGLVIYILESAKTDKELLWTYIILSVLLVLSALAKPSFFQGIVPGLGLYFIFALIAKGFKTQIKRFLLIALSFVPSACVIGFQFVCSFFIQGNIGEGNGIGIEFGRVLHNWSPHLGK